MIPPVFGLLNDVQARFEQLVHNCLLVAGGFLAGYLAGGAAAWAANRYIARRKGPGKATPETFSKLCRTIGGIIGAIIVALLVFVGGMGGGPGRGAGDGSGNPDPNAASDKSGQTKPETPAKIESKVDLPKPPDPKPVDVTLRVTILGGMDSLNGPYLLGDDRTPKTFEALKSALLARKSAEPGRLGIEIAFPAKNVVELSHNYVTQLVRFARDEKIRVGYAE